MGEMVLATHFFQLFFCSHTQHFEDLLPVWFSSVQSLCRVRLFATPWTAACQASLSITNSRSLLKLRSIESVMPSNHLILCHPLLLPPSIFPSIRVFSNESVLLIRWPKDWSFSFSIRPSNEHLGLISFRMDWLDLLAVQEILKSLLQHHSSKASILRCSAFFIVCHYQFRIIFSCVPTVSQSEGRNRQCRLRLESPSPSWAGLWTLSSMPSIYGNDLPGGKLAPPHPAPAPWKSPGALHRLKEYTNYLCK